MEKQSLSKKLLCAIAIIAALSAANTRAEKITLDFEGIGDRTPINDFYNGGADSKGNPGTNHGVYFSNDAEGIIDLDNNFHDFGGNFANEPSASTALIFRENGEAATMNVTAGFDSTLGLHYSSSADAIIRIFDGLDGTGNELATLSLGANHQNNGCSGDPNGDWCHWDQITMNFIGTAKSVVFDGPREFTFYDDITLGSETPDPAFGSGIIIDSKTPDPVSGSGNTPVRDLMSECKKDLKWHRRNSRNRRNVKNRHSLAYANLHNECKIFRWYRRGRR
jgi:hypothetical protein